MGVSQLRQQLSAQDICNLVQVFLGEKKSEDIVCINLTGKSAIADYMIIASGRSQRHIQATGEMLKDYLNEMGVKPIFVEGSAPCDWVLIDAGCVIVHLFRPEVRSHYNLEKMWGLDLAGFTRKASGEF